jgi:hypothetical protein
LTIRRLLEGLVAQLQRRLGLAVAFAQQRFQQQGHPGLGLAEQHRHLLAGKHLLAQALALDGLTVGLHHGQGAGVHLAGDVELVEGAVPLAQHAQQLEQEHAQLGVAGLAAHLVLQQLQRLLGVAVLQRLFSGGGCAHKVSFVCQTVRTSALKLVAPLRWPFSSCS